MGMAGPTPHEWLAAVCFCADYDPKTRLVTCDVDDWGNLVATARSHFGIEDLTDDDVVERGMLYRAMSARRSSVRATGAPVRRGGGVTP